jgi:site-specific recombinase XerD
MNNNLTALGNLIEGFRLSCQTEGKSPKTTEWYSTFLHRFHRFLSLRDNITAIENISRQQIRAFIHYLQTEVKTPHKHNPLSGATIQGYVRTLKAFFSWAVREGYIENNPMTGVPVPRALVKLVSTLNDEQLARLMVICQKTNPEGYRNMAILLLLLDTGIRVSELTGVEATDLDFTTGCIRIKRGKGARERIVPIGALVQKSLWRYLNHFRPPPLIPGKNTLFLNHDGIPLTRSGVQQMLRRCARRAGIETRCSPHVFRHTFARRYLINGGDIFSLQRILGHSSLASVRVYLNLFSGDIKSQHNRFSPVDNFTRKPGIHSLLR